MFTCDNCGHTEANPPAARDLDQRLDEDGVYTDRECSKCGCLTYERRIEHGQDCKPEHMTEPDWEGIRDCGQCGLWESSDYVAAGRVEA